MNFTDFLDDDELPNPDYDLMLLWDSEEDLDFVWKDDTVLE